MSSELDIFSKNSTQDVLATLSFFLVLFAFTGLLVWLAIDFSEKAPFICSAAKQEDSGEYVRFVNRSADPYNGAVTKVQKGNVDTCKAACSSSTDSQMCRFFTFDRDSQQCSLYTNGILPDQNETAAFIGPTERNQDVYVIKENRFVEMLGVFANDQTV
jgi:hypothetical protein